MRSRFIQIHSYTSAKITNFQLNTGAATGKLLVASKYFSDAFVSMIQHELERVHEGRHFVFPLLYG